MRRFSGLHRRGDIWHYRRWVPLHLRERVGRTEITKSLHTADYSIAKQRYRTVIEHVDRILQQATEQRLTDDFDYSGLLQEFATVKAPPRYDNDGLKTLIKTVVEEVVGQTMPVKKSSITLSELYRRYMDDPPRQRSRKTIMTYQSAYNVLIDIFEKDRLISDINREDCRQFMDVVRHLPTNARKKFLKKNLVEISTIARENNFKAMSPLTINKYLSKLLALLAWAVEEELLDHNPAKNLSVADPVHAQDKRLPFSEWLLRKIFAGLVDKSGAEYCVPHIGLWNGLRLNKICQLNVKDVVLRDEVWCFNITRKTDRGIDDKVLSRFILGYWNWVLCGI